MVLIRTDIWLVWIRNTQLWPDFDILIILVILSWYRKEFFSYSPFSTLTRYYQHSNLLVFPWYSKNVLKRLYYDYYFHRQESLWRQNALNTLPVLLNSSDMLACGEDLGLIPSCVHPVCSLNHYQFFPFPARGTSFFHISDFEHIDQNKKVSSNGFNFYAGHARVGINRFAHSTYAKWTWFGVWYSISIQLHDGEIFWYCSSIMCSFYCGAIWYHKSGILKVIFLCSIL